MWLKLLCGFKHSAKNFDCMECGLAVQNCMLVVAVVSEQESCRFVSQPSCVLFVCSPHACMYFLSILHFFPKRLKTCTLGSLGTLNCHRIWVSEWMSVLFVSLCLRGRLASCPGVPHLLQWPLELDSNTHLTLHEKKVKIIDGLLLKYLENSWSKLFQTASYKPCESPFVCSIL